MKYSKYLIISIISVLIFITSNCFAVDQKLIDGMAKYEAATGNLEDIETDIKIEKKNYNHWLKELDEERSKKDVFYSTHSIHFCQNEIAESKKLLIDLSVKYSKAKKGIGRLEPIKNEYYKQVAIERKQENLKDTIIHFGKITGLPIAFLLLITFLSKLIAKRNKKLLKEGKITQEEYGQIMNGDNKSRLFDNDKGVNPATGLPLVGNGVCDAGGNIRGSSSRDSFFDSSQEYRDRHRWD